MNAESESYTETSDTMNNNSQGSVKALVRGLDVLVAMNDLAPATISKLVKETGYPKATVIRLLQTLCNEGYAEEADGGRGYRVSPKVLALSRSLSTKHRYQQAADQVLKDLGATLKWPTEMLICDGHSMIIETSNRDSAPIKLQIFERRRFPVLESAGGIAYLSALPVEQADTIIREVVETIGISEPLSNPIETMRERVIEAKKLGYTLRSYHLLSADMRVLSVALSDAGQAVGALSLVHYGLYLPDALLQNTVLPILHSAATAISDNLQRT